MARTRAKKRGLRALAAPLTVAAPSGARIRDRLRPTDADARAPARVGRHPGHHARTGLARCVETGQVPATGNRGAEWKKALTAVSSSRWAGAMTRASQDQYQLSTRCLYDGASFLGTVAHRQRPGEHRRIGGGCG